MVEKSIKINNRIIDYTLKINKRSKSLRLAVHPGGHVVVTVPKYIPQLFINRFIVDKSAWLINKIDILSKIVVTPILSKKARKDEYLKYKDEALELVKNRLVYFNQFYKYRYNRITIRNQKTRWGSCSKNGNLNFNYKIVLLPTRQSDYIIIHELCHLKEFNHGKKFWDLVFLTEPLYKDIRKSLKQNALKLS